MLQAYLQLIGSRSQLASHTYQSSVEEQKTGPNGNRLANSPLSTQTSSDKNGWKTKPCPQVYPLNKPVSDVAHAEL
ncbi:hypothetical protein, partial [Pseudomonas mandelii]|uniref:hypothetical protein n=1 Tax=Pseudomonas mandelii TaxID=75612 RepID=UPI001C950BCB